jgi:hypothetical protein
MSGTKLTAVALLSLLPGVHAYASTALSNLSFTPRPLSAEPVPVRADAPPIRSTQQRGPESARNLSARDDDLLPESLVASLRERLDAIVDEITLHGPRSPALPDEFVTLAALYQQSSDHPAAIGVLEQALNVIRVNEGLSSVNQVPVLEMLGASRMAIGQRDVAFEIDQQILELAMRNRGDPRVPGIIRGIADRQMREVQRLLVEGEPPQLTISMQAAPGPVPYGPAVGFGGTAAQSVLRMARRHYAQGLLAAIGAGDRQPAELFELEERIIETYYFELEHFGGNRRSSPIDNPRYRAGAAVFEAHVANTQALRQSPTAVAEALIRLGDWRLLFSDNGRALAAYRSAHRLLVAGQVDEDTIAELLTPEIPQALPEAPGLGEADPAPHYAGYIDVSFLVSRYGTSRRVEIIDSSPGTSRAIERRLKREISMSRFRPRIVDGELARGDEISARYYYSF